MTKLKIGDQLALFKTRHHLSLRREDKNLYFLSAGVGLATFRPLILNYLQDPDSIKQIHSIHIDSSNEFLFTDLFTSDPHKGIIATNTNNRQDYYQEVNRIANDSEGIYYIIGSDPFIIDHIRLLTKHGIPATQIMLDKREEKREELFKQA